MMRSYVLFALLLCSAACKKRAPEDIPSVVLPPAAPAAPPAPAPAPEPAASSLGRAWFAFDSAALSEDAKRALGENARLLSAHPEARVELQGHADERGTTEYNLALGQRRAQAARSFLVAQGVAASRLSAVSYGEERPLRGGADEGAWAQNRRVELRLTSSTPGLEGTVP